MIIFRAGTRVNDQARVIGWQDAARRANRYDGSMSCADAVQNNVELSLGASHFFVREPGTLRMEHARDEEVAWETFRGHLLDAAHCIGRRRFRAWHVFVDDEDTHAPAPLVSVYWDREAGRIAIVRRILTHGFEAYEDPPGVILSRPVRKWLRELVGTIDLATIGPGELAGELRTGLFLAVIGVSRLPITSLESPLPSFSLGLLAYFPSLDFGGESWWTDPVALLRAALSGRLAGVELAKALETALRAAADQEQPQIAQALADHAAATEDGLRRVCEMLRATFRYVSLSPYGSFVDRLIALLAALADGDAVGTAAVTDSISTMLRQLCRHLTAFDLATFHNSGANYPDALFLDALLKQFMRLVASQPSLLIDEPGDSEAEQRARRIRRRALRQACLLRQHYERLRVPDAPTSQGELLRVLPEPLVRVPEEQIAQASKRRRVLFADEPLDGLLTPVARQSLQAGLADLDQATELLELGRAYFLDRPLGVLKQPGEVDRTPLVSHTAVSRTVVKRRLAELLANGWIAPPQHDRWRDTIDALPIAGVPVAELTCVERPGVVSLADTLKVAPDFVLQRSRLDELVACYDWTIDTLNACDVLASIECLRGGLLVHHVTDGGLPTLRIYDSQLRLRLELDFGHEPGDTVRYVERDGVEWVDRLRVRAVWEENGGPELVERRQIDVERWIVLRGALREGAGRST